MVNGEIGSYKITYIKGKPDVLYSKMFDGIDAALDYGHKLPGRWLLFKKAGQDKQDYAWKLLPYGAASSFTLAIRADQARWVILIAITIIGFYLFGKFFFKTPAKIY
jgi:hypothetical protein